MQNLTGMLVFSGNWLNRPWALIQDDGSTVDLYPLINEALLKMNGKSAEQKEGRESYSITLSDSAEMVIKYESDGMAMLEKPDAFGMSNIGAYLPSALTWLSGRKVTFDINNTGFIIAADPNEKVFGVEFFGRGNSCRIPEGAEKSVCKIGTPDCCIFMVAGSDGFTCEKFGGMGAMLLDHHFKGTMNAPRVGNCALVGREEDTTPKGPGYSGDES